MYHRDRAVKPLVARWTKIATSGVQSAGKCHILSRSCREQRSGRRSPDRPRPRPAALETPHEDRSQQRQLLRDLLLEGHDPAVTDPAAASPRPSVAIRLVDEAQPVCSALECRTEHAEGMIQLAPRPLAPEGADRRLPLRCFA